MSCVPNLGLLFGDESFDVHSVASPCRSVKGSTTSPCKSLHYIASPFSEASQAGLDCLCGALSDENMLSPGRSNDSSDADEQRSIADTHRTAKTSNKRRKNKNNEIPEKAGEGRSPPPTTIAPLDAAFMGDVESSRPQNMLSPKVVHYIDEKSKAIERKTELELLRQQSLAKPKAAKLSNAEAPSLLSKFLDKQREMNQEQKRSQKDAMEFLHKYRADEGLILSQTSSNASQPPSKSCDAGGKPPDATAASAPAYATMLEIDCFLRAQRNQSFASERIRSFESLRSEQSQDFKSNDQHKGRSLIVSSAVSEEITPSYEEWDDKCVSCSYQCFPAGVEDRLQEVVSIPLVACSTRQGREIQEYIDYSLSPMISVDTDCTPDFQKITKALDELRAEAVQCPLPESPKKVSTDMEDMEDSTRMLAFSQNDTLQGFFDEVLEKNSTERCKKIGWNLPYSPQSQQQPSEQCSSPQAVPNSFSNSEELARFLSNHQGKSASNREKKGGGECTQQDRSENSNGESELSSLISAFVKNALDRPEENTETSDKVQTQLTEKIDADIGAKDPPGSFNPTENHNMTNPASSWEDVLLSLSAYHGEDGATRERSLEDMHEPNFIQTENGEISKCVSSESNNLLIFSPSSVSAAAKMQYLEKAGCKSSHESVKSDSSSSKDLIAFSASGDLMAFSSSFCSTKKVGTPPIEHAQYEATQESPAKSSSGTNGEEETPPEYVATTTNISEDNHQSLTKESSEVSESVLPGQSLGEDEGVKTDQSEIHNITDVNEASPVQQGVDAEKDVDSAATFPLCAVSEAAAEDKKSVLPGQSLDESEGVKTDQSGSHNMKDVNDTSPVEQGADAEKDVDPAATFPLGAACEVAAEEKKPDNDSSASSMHDAYSASRPNSTAGSAQTNMQKSTRTELDMALQLHEGYSTANQTPGRALESHEGDPPFSVSEKLGMGPSVAGVGDEQEVNNSLDSRFNNEGLPCEVNRISASTDDDAVKEEAHTFLDNLMELALATEAQETNGVSDALEINHLRSVECTSDVPEGVATLREDECAEDDNVTSKSSGDVSQSDPTKTVFTFYQPEPETIETHKAMSPREEQSVLESQNKLFAFYQPTSPTESTEARWAQLIPQVMDPFHQLAQEAKVVLKNTEKNNPGKIAQQPKSLETKCQTVDSQVGKTIGIPQKPENDSNHSLSRSTKSKEDQNLGTSDKSELESSSFQSVEIKLESFCSGECESIEITKSGHLEIVGSIGLDSTSGDSRNLSSKSSYGSEDMKVSLPVIASSVDLIDCRRIPRDASGKPNSVGAVTWKSNLSGGSSSEPADASIKPDPSGFLIPTNSNEKRSHSFAADYMESIESTFSGHIEINVSSSSKSSAPNPGFLDTLLDASASEASVDETNSEGSISSNGGGSPSRCSASTRSNTDYTYCEEVASPATPHHLLDQPRCFGAFKDEKTPGRTHVSRIVPPKALARTTNGLSLNCVAAVDRFIDIGQSPVSSASSVSPRRRVKNLKRVPLYVRRAPEKTKVFDGPICNQQYAPHLHQSREACERCLYWASSEEKEKFQAAGHHHRILLVRGGCDRGCKVFPRENDEIPVRLCRKCYFDTHKDPTSS